ncbi:HEAT repeat domain-containing protein [Rosistilla oblonga]|uniref:HEAT repeat domain-containing protein n=1 Tax=Rosistilla oblonga TaxID=2527990 RepID=UPI003A96DC5D
MNHDQSSNPFAYRRQRRFAGWPWWAAIGVVIVLTVFVVPRVCNWFLLNQLTQGIEDLPLGTQTERLQAIGHLGVPGIPVLVKSLGHRDRGVARSSLQVLKSMQDQMMQKGDAEGAACHFELTRQLADQLPQIPQDRHPWVGELLNQTLLDTLDIDLQRAKTSYRTATSLLSQLVLPVDATANAPLLATAAPALPIAVSRQATPQSLPTNLTNEAEFLPNLQPLAVAPATQSPASQNVLDENLWVDPTRRPLPTPAAELVETSSLEPEMLTSGPAATEAPVTLPIGGSAPILSAGGYSTDGALEAYSTRAVIDLLSSIRKPLASAARSELIQRGFQPVDLSLAIRLASTNADVRNSLIDDITNRSDIDPRRWLLWLAEDAERSVRLRALAALGTMRDPNVAKELRSLLSTEQDPAVAARIRQALVR